MFNFFCYLLRIHLVVRVSGVVSKKSFEADPGLRFTFHWDKRNVYNQVRGHSLMTSHKLGVRGTPFFETKYESLGKIYIFA